MRYSPGVELFGLNVASSSILTWPDPSPLTVDPMTSEVGVGVARAWVEAVGVSGE